jgi:uncharacterized membrane protein SpoIIM required for sporulation
VDYARFVRLRSPLWDAFEKGLGEAKGALPYGDLEAIADAYRQVLHDHALLSSRYPQTSAARRLARLSREGTRRLHWDRSDRLPGFSTFVVRTFPRAFRRQAPEIGLAAALFVVAVLFGGSLGLAQPGSGAAILGPEAVAGLRQGHLWTESIVGLVPPALVSSAIGTNNMIVALAGFAGGALAGLGAFYVVLFNGFIFGLILATTLHYGLAGALLGFVAAHGPLEITLIVCTAGAGLSLGRAMVVAEDRPRREVLKEASRDALVILVGCLPWFLVLGVVEAFISPSFGISVVLKIGLGAGLWSGFAMMAWNPSSQEE